MLDNQENPFVQKRQQSQLRLIIIAAVVLVIVTVGLILFLRGQRTGILILEKEPLTIRLNGTQVNPSQQERGYFLKLYAGRYRLQIERSGYLPFTEDIETKPGNILEIKPAFALMPSVRESGIGSIDFVRPSKDERSVYYLGDYRTRLFRLEVSSQVAVPLTEQDLAGVTDVQWSTDPNLALITQANGVYLHEIPLFDFQNQIYIKVADNDVISPVWDPTNTDRIAAAYAPNSGERSLIVADKRFTKIQRLYFIDIPTPKIAWSADGTKIMLLGRSANRLDQNLWVYTLADGKLIRLTQNGGVQDARFSPDGSKLLAGFVDSSGQESRAVINASTGQATVISGTTAISRIAWRDNDSFYEPDPNRGLLLHFLDDKTEFIPVSLPNQESIQTMIYYSNPAKIILATASAVYTVSLDK